MYVATGFSSTCGIAIYSLRDYKFLKLLTYHRELPQSVACLSSKKFVSGSLDGTIIVWNSESSERFLAEHTLHSPAKCLKDDKDYQYNISFLLPIRERYVVAGIGKSFMIFDLRTKTGTSCPVLQCLDAHDAAVTCAITLCNGAYLLTSSEDSMIKMWKIPKALNLNESLDCSHSKDEEEMVVCDNILVPELVMELYGHTGAVFGIVKIDEYSFASCSFDSEVIIWKDGYRQSELRNEYAVYSLMHEKY